MKNLKIGQRLALSFGSVVAILVVLACIAYVQIDGLDDAMELTNQDRYPKTVVIHHIKDDINEIARGMRNTLLSTDAKDVENEFAIIARNIDVIEKNLRQLDGTVKTPDGRRHLSALTDTHAKFRPLLDNFVRMAKSGLQSEATALLFTELRPVQTAYFSRLDDLADYQAGLMKKSGDEANTQADTAKAELEVLAAAAIFLSALFAYLATRSITRPLSQAVELARKVADGDLTGRIEVRSRDETGQLLQALKDMNEGLVRIVSQVRIGTDTIATASSQIASGNLDLSSRTEEQASSLEETASSMEELTSTVKQNADNARQSNQLVLSASDVARRGGQVVSQVVETMGSINESANKIVDIIGVIDGIAFQTNILALNAAVEAARAGEQGRGFAVVASEVRNLAQRSANAAKEIKALIGDSVDKVSTGSRLVNEAGATMQEVVESVQRVTDIMSEITAASQEQTAGIEQINQAVMQMDQVTQQNAALVEEAAAAAESLQDQADKLSDVVSVFKLDGTVLTQVQASAPARLPRPDVKPERNGAARPTLKPAAAQETRRIPAPAANQPAAAVASGEWEQF
ncbi:MAG TPA: methyl-accepting chemotaxis protein [Oxalicibacterium sp.]|nr:methyl-accepting chemotaxis protein [Oxalicibacterium sp.]